MEVSSATAIEIEEAKEKEDLRTIEAILFVSGKFLSMSELVTLSNLNPVVVKELIEKLKERYEKFDSALEVVEKNDLWKMDVKQEYSHFVTKLATGDAEFSKAEQETLAIVAYKQPIKQSVIIKIRGNKAYEHLDKFESLSLIKRKREGHTSIITLSEDFYDYFNVREGGKPFEESDITDDEDEPEEKTD
jgi:segregation and condensation protein B